MLTNSFKNYQLSPKLYLQMLVTHLLQLKTAGWCWMASFHTASNLYVKDSVWNTVTQTNLDCYDFLRGSVEHLHHITGGAVAQL